METANNSFQQSLSNPQRFTVTWELVPGRGAREKIQENTIAAALLAAKSGRIDAVTITDNPGGNPALLADYLGMEIVRLGIEPLVHFTCKDRNRNQIESQLHALNRAGIHNLLVMTGDYPALGFQGKPAPVFDLDPIHTIKLISEMNAGFVYPGPKEAIRNQPANFYAGCAVSPFKATEAEQMAQYFKLKKKISAGAQFVVSQLGYDARKFHELLMFMKLHNLDVPVIGNIYVLPYGAARLMNENKLPGSVVTDKLLSEIDGERSSPDNGLKARLMRAAKMYAFMKGMGFGGVHIAGHGVQFEQVSFIIDKGEELSGNWPELVREFDYPLDGGFYFFEKDKTTGLNSNTPTSLAGLPPAERLGMRYKMSRFFHRLVFQQDGALFDLMKKIAKAAAGSAMEKILHKAEHLTKIILYDCRDCGDCALHDVAYACPMSRCPKNQRNGACGGSRDGWCEVHPKERLCIYVLAYTRLKRYGEEKTLETNQVPPCDWALYQTSSWINYFLGRDHFAKLVKFENSAEKK